MRKIMSNNQLKNDLEYLPYNLRSIIAHPTAICQCRSLIFAEAHSVFFYE